MSPPADRDLISRFRSAYAAQRAHEGRRLGDAQLLATPFLTQGPLARQWKVRACTFRAFIRNVLIPESSRLTRPLALLDLGAGNGWLCHRAAAAGSAATALDLRDDDVDGRSQFYSRDEQGRAMVVEKRRNGATQFGDGAEVLLAPPFIEYLTSASLHAASRGLGLDWRRWRVRYPLWYECRGVTAMLRGRRAPSRFDLGETRVP